ncbi:NINE protein [Tissierella sp.]|uniref:NINE protein n=1 Tax=Tissierella sp. TaxID=41274 RepID=UPI002858442C|nr:NINE protein [Tissierella sp.]MDR7856833.1 hypothetical protein [Tissierella sp.]
MRPKSKFMTFLLSFLPGLSHFYLGYMERGFIYLILFGGLCVGSVGLAILTGRDDPLILLAGIPIIWLVALVDAFSTLNTIRYGNKSEIEERWNSEETKKSNKKIITLALSMIPGAGHMYLGYQKKGIVYMGIFFFAIFFMGWLNLSFLLFLLPLIWFYSFFDAFHTLNGNNVEDVDIDFSKILPAVKHEHIGIGLIVIGVFIVLQKILYPIISSVLSTYFDYNIIYQIKNYIQTSIVSLIFIIGGFKILKNKKELEVIYEEIEVEEDGEEDEK